MTSTLTHPTLRGRRADDAGIVLARPRRTLVPGVATGAFWILASLVTVLNMIGLVMVMSASSVISVKKTGSPWMFVRDQAMFTALGLGALALTLLVSVDFWRRFTRAGLLTAGAMLALVLVPGIGLSVNGARRWLGFGPVVVQPSEFAKFALLLFVADLLARRSDRIEDWRWTLAPVITYLAIVAALIMAEPNLGTTIIVAAIVLVMLLVSGVRLAPLSLATGIGAAVATSFVAGTTFRRRRFLSFLDPMKDPTGIGQQGVQSMVAMANGGIFGRGLGRSTVKWGYLPYAWTDFIFAVIGEEFGLVGAMTVVLLFVALAVAGAVVAARAKDRFSLLVAVGITTWLIVQAIMNIGAVVGALPITGVPLPFISSGGSALVVNLAAVGMLLNIARHPVEPSPRLVARAAR
ncbi:MAG: stage sporulation protein [Acidimicrobiales bacterium]|nr:stage sporulation protein [Acidimicrobiales bacterium]